MSYITPARLKTFKTLQDKFNENKFSQIDHIHSQYLTAHPTVIIDTDTTSTLTTAFGDVITVVSGLTKDKFGHVTKIELSTVTVPDSISTVDSEGNTTTVSLADLVSRLIELESKVAKLENTLLVSVDKDTVVLNNVQIG